MPKVPSNIVGRCPCYSLIDEAGYADTLKGREEIPALYGCAEGGPCRGGAENDCRPEVSECPMYAGIKKQALPEPMKDYYVISGMVCPHCLYEGRVSELLLNVDEKHLACSNAQCDGSWHSVQDFLADYQVTLRTASRDADLLLERNRAIEKHAGFQREELKRLRDTMKLMRAAA